MPTGPFTATSASVMSQDVISTSDVVLDSTANTPVATFMNPSADNTPGNTYAEALVIVPATTTTPRGVAHVARNTQTDGGWTVTLTPGDTSAAAEVAAGTVGGVAYGVYTDGGALYANFLQTDGTWSAWSTLMQPTVSNLRTTYTPDQNLVIYGADIAGNLVILYQQIEGQLPNALTITGVGNLNEGDFSLVMNDESDWNLVANTSNGPQIYTGALGPGTPVGPTTVPISGAVQHIVGGYWSGSKKTLMFFYTDSDDNLSLWWNADGNQISKPILNGLATTATTHVKPDGTVHLYAIDGNQNLAVVHQSVTNPWEADGSPHFAPSIGLDTSITGVVSDSSPVDVPTLFAVTVDSQGATTLRFHAQDLQTAMWTTGSVQQSQVAANEVTRFRTEVTLVDANLLPVTNYPVTLTTAPNYSAGDVWACGAVYNITTKGTQMTTDSMGKLTFATMVNSTMVAPNVIFSVDQLETPLAISPAGPVHTYLAGQGSINPTLPSRPGAPPATFDSNGTALQNAQTPAGNPVVTGSPSSGLLQVAAGSIQQTSQAGLGQSADGVVGFAFNFRDPQPVRLFYSLKELDAHVAALKGTADSVLGDLEEWSGDVCQAVASGLMALEQGVVTIADGIATFLTNVITSAVDVVIDGLEQAAALIAGVFKAIAAAIMDVINWLKALFDFAAIFRTKAAIQAAVNSLPAILTGLIGKAQGAVPPNWLQTTLGSCITNAQNSTQFSGSFGSQSGFTQPGSSAPVSGNAAPSDFSNNVHHNWIQDKVSSGNPSNPSTGGGVGSSWQDFVSTMTGEAADFITQLGDFATWVFNTLTSPAQLAALTMTDFLSQLQNVLDAGLALGDTLLQSVISSSSTLVSDTMTALQAFFDLELNLGFLNELWDWISNEADAPNDPLTVGALISLLLAFPTTIIYKLIQGVDSEPFPVGSPIPGSANLAGTVSPGWYLTGAILQTLYFIPACLIIIQGFTLWWLTLGLSTIMAAIWVMFNGVPDFNNWEWPVGAAAIALLVALAPVVFIFLNGLYGTTEAQFTAGAADIFRYLVTTTGLVLLALAIDNIVKSDEFGFTQAASIFTPLPSMVSFLQASTFKTNEAATEVCALITAIGYITSGVCQLEEANSMLSLSEGTA